MSLKKNILYKNLKISSLVLMFMSIGAQNASALEVESIYSLPGINAAYIDNDVPIALKVLTAEDGISRNAYLYRHTYKGVDYYAPWVPEQYAGTDADKNGNSYRNWGFWNMQSNRTDHTITAPYYYTGAKVITETRAKNANGNNAGTLPVNAIIQIAGIDTDNNEVYVDANTNNYLSQGSAASELVAVNMDHLSFSGYTKYNTLYSLHPDTPSSERATQALMLENFKRYGKYVDNLRSVHLGMDTNTNTYAERGNWVNPNTTNVPISVRGLPGEWRYIGYNRYGDPLDNPYFLADAQSCGSTYFYGASRRLTPWKTDDAETGESDVTEAFRVFKKGMNEASLQFEYDDEDNVDYSRMKDYVIDKLYSAGAIKTKSDVKNRFSLKTNAYKQGIILKTQRKDYVYYQVPFMPGTLRDLYASRMEIFDVDDNYRSIAVLTSDGTSSKVSQTGYYVPGRAYQVKVRLSNGANAQLIKQSIETQFGLTFGSSSINPNMVPMQTRNQSMSRKGNYAGITELKHSQSVDFSFVFNVSSNETRPIDVYGFVGMSHSGVDNLNYNNDTIGIRLVRHPNPPPTPPCNIIEDGTVRVCGTGDIAPEKIELLDESGNVKYSHSASSGVTVRNAIIPGNKYKIRYTAKYTGDDIKKYEWIPPINDDPATNADESRDGYWNQVDAGTYNVPLTYHITRPVKNPSTQETYSYNGNTIYFSKDGSTNIKMLNDTSMSYTTDAMMMQYPYLTTGMKITSTNSRINETLTNDSMSTTLNDTFDISINDLVVRPSIVYTDGTTKKVNYNVTYDADLTLPSYVGENDYQAYISTAITINGVELPPRKDQLRKGSNDKITHIIENVNIPGNGNISVSVNLNSDRLSYESGNYNNNDSSTSVQIKNIMNPGDGNPNDTVNPTNNGSSSASVGGDANNNCLTPRTKNTWTSTHRKLAWSSDTLSYVTLVSGDQVSFKKYKVDLYQDNAATETYTENFNIVKVMFKSKETTENKRGANSDGWINLLDTGLNGEAKYAEVKAGYGFELKIITNYNTDALTKRVWNISNNGSSGTSISALNGGINHGMKEVFLELPGTKGSGSNVGTRKILSTTGYGDSVVGLEVSDSGGNDNKTWTYTIKPSNTLGIGETPKIYIPQGMKNGDYKLKIYTTPVEGVGSVNKNYYSALCDRKEVIIKVQGAATDDLNSNIVQ